MHSREVTNRITKITIKNYKSLKDCTVELGALNVLVGANGSGKSNFLDALEFIRNVLRSGLRSEFVINDSPYPQEQWYTTFKIDMTIDGIDREYEFVVHASNNSILLEYEKYISAGSILFERRDREWIHRPENIPEAWLPHRILLLFSLAHLDEVHPVYDFLINMGFYDISPEMFLNRPIRYSGPSYLDKHGQNLDGVLHSFLVSDKDHHWVEAFKESLKYAVNYIMDISPLTPDTRSPVLIQTQDERLELIHESYGTLRLIGNLLALYQQPWRALIGIEEPENNVHPGALGVLVDVIKEAATRSQIIITTHSPDMISRFDVNDLRIVERTEGGTKIGFLEGRQRELVDKLLSSTSDLLFVQGELRRETE